MAFDLTKKININDVINYNYDETTFYSNQYEKTFINGGYIKIPYSSKSNKVNISSNLFENDYNTTNLYITNKIHTIPSIDYDGELIIEHKPLTNNDKPLYSCFLLKTIRNESINGSQIDELISGKIDTILNLNKYIESSNGIYYNNSENVIIFTKPIIISSHISDYKSPEIMVPFNKNYSIVTIKNLGNIYEGLENTPKTLAAYCQPIDENDPSIGETSSILIPSSGEVAINDATNTTIKTAINFCCFFLMLLFVIIIIPIIYKHFLLVLILDNEKLNAQGKLNRLSTADWFMSIILFLFSFALINNGISSNKSIYTIVGFYIFVFFLSSFLVLQYNRLFYKNDFLKQFNPNYKLETDDPKFENISIDPIGLISDTFSSLFVSKEIDSETQKEYLKFQFGGIFTVLVVFTVFFLMLYFSGFNDSSTSALMSLYFYIFIFSIYISVYIQYIRNNRIKNIIAN